MKITLDLDEQDLQEIFKKYVEETTGQTPEKVGIRTRDFIEIDEILIEF